MNWKRVVLGGIAAGLLIDVVEGGLSNLVIGEQFQREMSALGVKLEMTPSAGIFFVSWGFIVGLVSVWLYAVARSRLGPGPKTALCVAVAVWIIHGLLPHLRDAFLGLFSMGLSLKFAAFTLAWHVAATLVGAAVYRESATS
jgi:hypothetical protein